jgi:hypothetical protein
MNYLEFEELLKSGNAPPQVEHALAASGYAFNTGSLSLGKTLKRLPSTGKGTLQ